MKKFRFIFLIFLISLTLNVFAQNENKLVENLDIIGNRRLTDEELLKSIKTRAGDKFDQKRVQEDLQSLLALGVFNTTDTGVIIETGVRGGVNVIFQVHELPLVAEINFDGLRYVKKEEILAELREKNLKIKAGEPYQPQDFNKAKKIIKEFLKNRGFAEAKVSVSEEVNSATTIIIVFYIDEMPNDDEEDCCAN